MREKNCQDEQKIKESRAGLGWIEDTGEKRRFRMDRKFRKEEKVQDGQKIRLRMNRRRATESRYNGSAINEPFVKRERKRNVSDKVRLI